MFRTRRCRRLSRRRSKMIERSRTTRSSSCYSVRAPRPSQCEFFIIEVLFWRDFRSLPPVVPFAPSPPFRPLPLPLPPFALNRPLRPFCSSQSLTNLSSFLLNFSDLHSRHWRLRKVDLFEAAQGPSQGRLLSHGNRPVQGEPSSERHPIHAEALTGHGRHARQQNLVQDQGTAPQFPSPLCHFFFLPTLAFPPPHCAPTCGFPR